MRHRPFLITGCGRSGTRYVADLLTSLGVPTGWEATLNPFYPTHKARDYPFLLRRLRFHGDANWLATAYLSRVPGSVIVFQQVRHPLRVVRSLLSLRFFGDDYLAPGSFADPRHYNLVMNALPGIRKFATAIERCLFYWVEWNKLWWRSCSITRRGNHYYRFEDLLDPLTGELGNLYFLLTGQRELPEIKWPANVHKIYGNGSGPAVTWGMIPDGPLKSEAQSLAEFYGYKD